MKLSDYFREFADVMSRFGLTEVARGDDRIEFRSATWRWEFSYDHRTGELASSVAPIGSRVQFSDGSLAQLMGHVDEGHKDFQADSPECISAGVEAMLARLNSIADSGTVLDQNLEEQLRSQCKRSELACELATRLSSARRKAEAAWSSSDYLACAEAYEQIREHLSASERKRLDLCRSRLASSRANR